MHRIAVLSGVLLAACDLGYSAGPDLTPRLRSWLGLWISEPSPPDMLNGILSANTRDGSPSTITHRLTIRVMIDFPGDCELIVTDPCFDRTRIDPIVPAVNWDIQL